MTAEAGPGYRVPGGLPERPASYYLQWFWLTLTTIIAAGLAWLAFIREQAALSGNCEARSSELPLSVLPPGPAGFAAGVLLAAALLRIGFFANRQSSEPRYRWGSSLVFWALVWATFRLSLSVESAIFDLCFEFIME